MLQQNDLRFVKLRSFLVISNAVIIRVQLGILKYGIRF